MKKLVSLAIAIAIIPTAAHAAEVIGVFKNRGACNAAWSHSINDDRKSGGPSQYYCEQSGDFWLLLRM